MAATGDGKIDTASLPNDEVATASLKDVKLDTEDEVFKRTENGVDFRTVGWLRASFIFTKIQFALGVLNIPNALYSLGALPGALCIVGFGALNTYSAILLGDFRSRHPGIHSVADMASLVGGVYFRELVGGLFILGNVLCVSVSIVGLSTALNALSRHAACTVWWSFISMIAVAVGGSMRTFRAVGWLTLAGFVSIFAAVLIVVISVTTLPRPAAAPQEGPFDLGYNVIAYPDFITGVAASSSIFVSSAGSSTFVPVIAEMKNPRDFNKAIYLCMAIVNGSYLAFSLVVYRWCGKWVASPSLGSAGQTMKMVAYGVALIGLLASAVVYLHVAAKYLFVRILRNTRHLQENTPIHWMVWLGTTFGLCTISFILAEAVPILGYLLALMSGICYAPLGIMLPAAFWMYDFMFWRHGTVLQRISWSLFVLMFLIGAFLAVGGTYSTIKLIILAYESGTIGSAFSCADNSGSS